MRRLRNAWNRYFFSEAPVLGLVCFRVLLCVWTLAMVGMRLPHLRALHGSPLTVPIQQLAPIADQIPFWLFAGIHWLAVVMVVLVAVNWNARIAHSLLLILSMFVIGWDTNLMRGFGKLAWMQWVLLYATPYDEPARSRAPVWGTRLLQLQFTAVYFFTVLAKVFDGFGWLNGRTLYYALHNPVWAREWVLDLDLSQGVTQILGLGVLASEAFAAIFLHFERTRRLAMLASFSLHLGIQVMMHVPVLFQAVMWIHLVLFVRWEPKKATATPEDRRGAEVVAE
jgi:Vitamin K-dependent gamma-carboxylase